MKKTDIIAKTAAITGLTKKDTEATVNALLDSIKESVKEGKKVVFIGFGSFEAKECPERIGHNPKTGENITIPAHKSIRFRAGKAFKDELDA